MEHITNERNCTQKSCSCHFLSLVILFLLRLTAGFLLLFSFCLCHASHSFIPLTCWPVKLSACARFAPLHSVYGAFEVESFLFAASLSLFAFILVGQTIAVNRKQLVRQFGDTDTPRMNRFFFATCEIGVIEVMVSKSKCTHNTHHIVWSTTRHTIRCINVMACSV